MESKITVAMPVFNVQKYIRSSLSSVLRQDFPNIEILIIDDKGTDGSMEIVKELMSLDTKGNLIRIIEHPNNMGTGAARNTAIENCTGNFLFFMDSDDELEPNCIRLLYDKMVEHPVDFVAASHVRRDTYGNISEGFSYEARMIEGHLSLASYVFIENGKFDMPLWNKLFDVNFLREFHLRCNPAHILEDMIFSYQLFLTARSCQLIPEVTYVYRFLNPTSSMNVNLKDGVSRRVAGEFVDYIDFKKQLSQQFQYEPHIYKYLIKDILCDSVKRSKGIFFSKMINRKEKREYITSIAKFDYKWSDICDLSVVFKFYYLFGHFPYYLKRFNLLAIDCLIRLARVFNLREQV